MSWFPGLRALQGSVRTYQAWEHLRVILHDPVCRPAATLTIEKWADQQSKGPRLQGTSFYKAWGPQSSESYTDPLGRSYKQLWLK